MFLTFSQQDSNEIALDHDQSGLVALTEALKLNSTLTSLNLWRTGLGLESGGILAHAIEQNHSLLFCDTGANYLDVGDQRRVVDKLDENLAHYELNERERRKQESVQQERRQRDEEKLEVRYSTETKDSSLRDIFMLCLLHVPYECHCL